MQLVLHFFFTQDKCDETLPSVTSLPIFVAASKGSLRKIITDATSRDDCGGEKYTFFFVATTEFRD